MFGNMGGPTLIVIVFITIVEKTIVVMTFY